MRVALVALAALLSSGCSDAFAQDIVGIGGPIFTNPATLSSNAPSFVLAQHTVFINSGVGSVPNLSGDATAVGVFEPNLDGGATWEGYDNTGAALSGTSQGTGTVFVSNVMGVPSLRAMQDVTDTTVPNTSNVNVRNLPGGDYLVICSGYGTTRQSSTEIWFEGYDGTRDWLGTATSGNWTCSETGNSTKAQSINSYGQPLDGEGIVWCRRSGNQLCAGTMAAESEQCITSSAVGALTSSHVTMGAGWGAGNAMRGHLNWCAFWSSGKSLSFVQSTILKWWGVSHPEAMLSPSLFGNVPELEGVDNTATTGLVDVYHSYAVRVQPSTGALTQRGFVNYANATPIDVSAFTTVNAPTIAANLIAGPFGQRLGTTPCGRITKSGATAGITSAAVPGLDGGAAGSGWYNATAFLARGDAGTNINHARIQWTWGSVSGGLDGGNYDTDGGCEISGLTDTAMRYPANPDGGQGVVGCYAWFTNPTLIQASVLVNDGSAFMCQEQVTATFAAEPPTIDNGGKGLGFIALDGGAMTSGTKQGGLGVVLQLPYTVPNLTNADPRAVSGFFEDAFASANPGHIVTHNYGAQAIGTQLLAIMYGPDLTTENYLLTTESIPAFTWFRVDLQWTPSAGKCTAKSYFQICPDQSNPQNCTIGPVINTGTAGECPNQIDTVYMGNRYDSSDNTNINLAVFDVWQ